MPVYATFPEIYGRHTSVYRSRAGSEVEGIKCLSTWEDVSFPPQEKSVGEAHGYTRKSDCDETEEDEFKRVAAKVPWPVVPNPWLIKQSLEHFFSLIEVPDNSSSWSPTPPTVMVLDGRGIISNKNAWEMISRWGEEAFPFSQGREEELRKSEWEKMCNYNQFVFRSLPFTKPEMKQGLPCAEMMLLFVGRSKQMSELSSSLDYALTHLKSHFKLYYIFRDEKCFCKDEKKRIKRKCSIPSISVIEAYRFWERINYLHKDLKTMGSDEKLVHVRKMVCGILSATSECVTQEIQLMVVDEKGEMEIGRGKEVIPTLFWWADNYSKLPTERWE
ncbi:hypothetical protein SUGI_0711390 [Cryptomeria japonica]|nr:hypothetical protein SUGI_0711390 [Cryptomeria japonica]